MDYSNKVSKAPSVDDLREVMRRLRERMKGPAGVRPSPPVVVPTWLADEMDRIKKEVDG